MINSKSGEKLHIILSAFVCDPRKGSEPGIGWNWLNELSKKHHIYLLTSSFQGQDKAINSALKTLSQKNNIDIIVIDFPVTSSRSKLSAFPLIQFYFQLIDWQKHALLSAQKLIQEREVDIIHHVTYASWLTCGFLWMLPRPYILGPVSGSQRIPLIGYSFLPLKEISKELFRTAYFYWARIFISSPKQAVKEADIVLCSNLETFNELKLIRGLKKTVVFSDTGAPSLESPIISRQKSNEHIIILWSGLIELRKNYGLLLKALQLIPTSINWELKVLGSGPLLEFWRQKTLQYGLGNKVQFLGQVQYSEMAKYYEIADILVFPSLREGTPTAILEGMSYGLPVVALRLHGARSVLSEGCGVLIDVNNPRQIVSDFADALTTLCTDENLRKKIGLKAAQRAKDLYTWDKRAERMLELYRTVL